MIKQFLGGLIFYLAAKESNGNIALTKNHPLEIRYLLQSMYPALLQKDLLF